MLTSLKRRVNSADLISGKLVIFHVFIYKFQVAQFADSAKWVAKVYQRAKSSLQPQSDLSPTFIELLTEISGIQILSPVFVDKMAIIPKL